MRVKIMEEQEMKEFTGKPKINKKSKSIKRKVGDLLDWKEKQDLRREQECKKKIANENDEMEKL
jgi:hypothetical protein